MGDKQRRASTAGPSNCEVCKAIVKEHGVSCSLCGVWLHLKCVSVTSSKAVESENVFVFCNGCTRAFNKFKSGIPLTESPSMDTFENFARKTDESIATLNGTINDLVAKLNPVLDVEAQDKKQKSFAEVAAAAAATAAAHNVVQEARTTTAIDVQRVRSEEIRRRSAVMIGLKESAADLETVNEICSFIDPCATVLEVFRMGERSDDPTKPRLLKIHFASSYCQRSIITGGSTLRNSQWSNIFVRRSLSPDELDLTKKLREKFASLNTDGFKHGIRYVVRDVKVNKFVNCPINIDEETGKETLGKGVRDRNFEFNCNVFLGNATVEQITPGPTPT